MNNPSINLKFGINEILKYLLILSPIITFCQDSIHSSRSFSGNYESYKTSYKDDLHTQNNFVEYVKFNISIQIKDTPPNGMVVIQDSRIPDKLLIYQIIKLDTIMSANNGDIIIYDVLSQHLENNQSEKITFYNSENKKMNLMVSDGISSQVFFNINKKLE